MSDRHRLIVIGVSAGGLQTLSRFLPQLPADFPTPIVIVQHVAEDAGEYLICHLDKLCSIPVREAFDKQVIEEGTVTIAPSGYHLLVESRGTLALSMDERVRYSRPSIDVLFESAADAYGAALTGIVLTGANSDGAQGLRRIKECGGMAVVQDPDDALYPAMPQSAIESTKPDHIVKLDQLPALLTTIELGRHV